jgi:putative endonuclease
MTSEGLGRRPFIATYIVTNAPYGTLYVGVTANLYARVAQHREGAVAGFSRTHGLKRLVWFEQSHSIVVAIAREKSLKRYRRDWKINLIERDNRPWRDLYEDFL